MKIELIKYENEEELMVSLISAFWEVHNHILPTKEETLKDLEEWTSVGHVLFFIQYINEIVGFVHLGSRGDAINWLEDIFVLPKYQNQGIGAKAIQMIEEIVKEYSDSLYIEAAARNAKAIRLYHKIGYDCLNTITIRKDFQPQNFETFQQESICGLDFNIKKMKDLEK